MISPVARAMASMAKRYPRSVYMFKCPKCGNYMAVAGALMTPYKCGKCETLMERDHDV